MRRNISREIGITPEASVNNPVLYDFLFETIWQDDASQKMEVIDLDTWLDDYATRRYGAESESANQAWDILKETVYKASLNGLGQGAPESVVNARPNLTIGAASTWGNAVISYEKGDLEEAAALLLADYDKLKDSAGYRVRSGKCFAAGTFQQRSGISKRYVCSVQRKRSGQL